MRQRRTFGVIAALFTACGFATACGVEPTQVRAEPSSVATPRAAEPLHPELVEILTERYPELAEEEALKRVPANLRGKLLIESLGSAVGPELAGAWYDRGRDVQHLNVSSNWAAAKAALLADRYQVVVKVHRVKYDDNQLRAVWESLLAGASPGIPALTIRTGSAQIDTDRNRVRVTLFHSPEAHSVAAKIVATYGDSVTVEVAPPSSPPTPGPNGLLPPVSVEDTLAWAKAGVTARLRTTLISKRGRAALCDAGEDSDPPQCSEPLIRVVGVPVEQLGLQEKNGVHFGGVDIVVTFTRADEARFVKQVAP